MDRSLVCRKANKDIRQPFTHIFTPLESAVNLTVEARVVTQTDTENMQTQRKTPGRWWIQIHDFLAVRQQG